jgi:hypothetical protein
LLEITEYWDIDTCQTSIVPYFQEIIFCKSIDGFRDKEYDRIRVDIVNGYSQYSILRDIDDI